MMSIGDAAAVVTGVGTLALAIAAFRQIRDNKGLIEAAKAQAHAAEVTAEQDRNLIEAATAQARAAEEQARAALDQAKASAQMIQEVQLDRELAWRPWLTIQSYDEPHFEPREIRNQIDALVQLALSNKLIPLVPNIRLAIQNIGPGPALKCRYVGYYSIPDDEARQALDITPTDPVFVGGRGYYRTDVFSMGGGGSCTVQANLVPGDALVTGAIDGTDWAGAAAEVNVLLCMDQFGRKYRFQQGRAEPEVWPPFPLATDSVHDNAPIWTYSVK